MWRETEAVDLIYDPPETSRPERADPAEYVPVREDLREILGAFGELSESDRRLVARRAEGYGYEDIAKLTGGTYTSVNRFTCYSAGDVQRRKSWWSMSN